MLFKSSGMILLSEQRKMIWSKELKSVYQKFPASIRSSDWQEIVKFANAGEIEKALMLAKKHQDLKYSHKAENIIARRIRIQRVGLLALQRQTSLRIRNSFRNAMRNLTDLVDSMALVNSNIARIRILNHEVAIRLRFELKTITTDSIWKSIILGVKNMGQAIKPVIKDNQESFRGILEEINLVEEKLTFGLATKFSNKSKGQVIMGSDKWTTIMDNLYQKIAMKSLGGLTLSERIWDLTGRMEMDLMRQLSSDIAQGLSARHISDGIQRYIFVNGLDDQAQTGPGIYKSPLKNALRLARTETSRAYANATATWAENKPWVKGISVTLSGAHEVEDECDDLAGQIYPPDEFAYVIPAHPHCMCFGTYVVDDSLLVDPNETDLTKDGEED